MDLRKPGDEIDNLSELDEESMEPEECFPEREYKFSLDLRIITVQLLTYCTIGFKLLPTFIL